VVPQGQDVIPRRPRGGASCKGVIPRRPRGDASLLGHNSIVSWWCLNKGNRIVYYWSSNWFGISCLFSQYLWLNMEMYVECTMWILFFFTSLPFTCLYDCVWFPFLQWPSTSLIWADVRTSSNGNNNRDAAVWWNPWTSIGLTLGAHCLGCSSSSSFSLALDETLYFV